jgi:2-C-methyl-D-erythritol 4-phosphate cytidylyltransferase/2-C-methyl-D-erythritol 2,4-cyclodiphosphate synthase
VRAGAIIVAAGRGDRLGAEKPKQFIELGGRTLLQRSVAAFDQHPAIVHLVVVLAPGLIANGPALAGAVTRPCTFAEGGARRQDSVANGMAAMPDDVDVVLVHDAARPFVDSALIDRVIEGVHTQGAAVPAIPVSDTVKRMDLERKTVAATIPRQEIWLAQTPQGFRRDVLTQAIALGQRGEVATDEAMLAEQAGHGVAIVAGDEGNMKITTPADLAAARNRVEPAVSRVGTGYDLHRLVDGRPLVLAGVMLSPDRGPESHSDGDVVCHAIVDAVLGAAAAGDIGRHFPNTDPAWKDAPGLDLLEKAIVVLDGLGWTVSNVDVTVILEAPKLTPSVLDIRKNLARVLDLPLEAVSVKAKTNEGVDAVGRGEAIAAHAVAMVASTSERAK